jgi:hypothetical protein
LAITDLSAATREQLTRMLGDRANYVTLKEGTKEPTGTYRQKGHRQARARVLEVPNSGNYGVIPVRDFFVLDIDVHKAELEKSKMFFERFFGVDLSQTLYLKTPSGGLHYYLRMPAGYVIFNGSLRPYSKKLAEMLGDDEVPVIDADIRSSDATGYVVGPGSFVSKMRDGTEYPTPGRYHLQGRSREILRSGDFQQLQEISEEAVKILSKLRTIQKEKSLPREQKEKLEKVVEIPLIESKPDPSVVIRVRAGLKRRVKKNGKLEYHRRRAFVSAALRCCYSDYTIALACVELEVDRDSYTSKRLSMWQIIDDLHRLRKSNPHTDHTSYCLIGQEKVRSRSEKTLDQFLEETKIKLQTRTLAREKHRKYPRVVHVTRVIARLEAEKRRKLPQVTSDALLLIDLLFQPLLNVGASRVVLAVLPVSEALQLTPSRVSAATRLLRSKRIISLVDKQKTGLAPTYTVTEDYIHKPLTAAIKHQWNQTKEQSDLSSVLLYDRFSRSFLDLVTGEIHELGFDVSQPERKELLQQPMIPLEIFATKYLRDELATG